MMMIGSGCMFTCGRGSYPTPRPELKVRPLARYALIRQVYEKQRSYFLTKLVTC